MSDRVCIRGCVIRGAHRDDCEHSGQDYQGQFPCRGCLPKPARHMSYVCDGCYSRFAKLLGDVADLLARVESLDDPAKATPTDQEHVRGSGSTVAPDPVNDDRLDARMAIEANLREWAAWAEGVPLAEIVGLPHEMLAGAVRDRLDDIVNDREQVWQLAEAVLNVHKPNEHGERETWSIWDAVLKWRVEREPSPGEHWTDIPNVEESSSPEDAPSWIAEWKENRIISKAEAASIAGTPRTLERWVKAELVEKLGTITMPDENGRIRPVSVYREQQVRAVKAAKDAEERYGQFTSDTPSP